jgi:hypothetical protein
LILLDADCIVEKTWLGALIDPLVNGAEAALGNYYPDKNTPVSSQYQMDKISSYFIRGGTTLHGGSIALQTQGDRAVRRRFPKVCFGRGLGFEHTVGTSGIQKEFVPAPNTPPSFLPPGLSSLKRNTVETRPLFSYSVSMVRYQSQIRFPDGPDALPHRRCAHRWSPISLPLRSSAPALSGDCTGRATYLFWSAGRRVAMPWSGCLYRKWAWLSYSGAR